MQQYPEDPQVFPKIPRTTDVRFWAFISYSHKDKALARWLQRSIEDYSVPKELIGRKHPFGKIPKRFTPVFRDREDLPATSDLDNKIQSALAHSLYLIVLCSPESARSEYVAKEVRFFKALGYGDRILPLIIDGEPNVGGPTESQSEECFSPALRFQVNERGELTDQFARAPLAADLRKGGDGKRLALLKILAGLMQVDLDELRRREQKRQRTHRMYQGITASVLICIGLLSYLSLSDAGINLPRSEEIRLLLDRSELSLFRHPYPNRRINETAVRLRRRLTAALLEHYGGNGIFYKDLTPNHSETLDPWTTSQILAALARSPEFTRVDSEILRASFNRMFSPGIFSGKENGALGGWKFIPDRLPQGEIALWMATALAMALNRDDLFSSTEHGQLRQDFNLVVKITEPHYPVDDGGWNMFADLQDPRRHNYYTTTLALQALLNAQESKMLWGGSPQRHNHLLVATSQWLIEGYDETHGNPGWWGAPSEQSREIQDGLTLQIYSLLLRVEAIAQIKIPGRLLENLTKHLISCIERGTNYPVTAVGIDNFVLQGGKVRLLSEDIIFQWYPWAIECAALWLQRAERVGAAREDIVRVRRALGHLVVDLGEEYVTNLLRNALYAPAELLYCLSALPVDELRQD